MQHRGPNSNVYGGISKVHHRKNLIFTDNGVDALPLPLSLRWGLSAPGNAQRKEASRCYLPARPLDARHGRGALSSCLLPSPLGTAAAASPPSPPHHVGWGGGGAWCRWLVVGWGVGVSPAARPPLSPGGAPLPLTPSCSLCHRGSHLWLSSWDRPRIPSGKILWGHSGCLVRRHIAVPRIAPLSSLGQGAR